MSKKILNIRPPITYLDFEGLLFSEESAQQGEGIVEILASIKLPTLIYLNFGFNDHFMKD